MSYNLYQPQPLKIEYGNLAQNINKEELENAIKNPVEKNRMYQLLTGIKDKVQPVTNALSNAIFGQEEPGTIIKNDDGTTSITVNNNRKGGVLGFANDVAKGFGENVSTPYNPNNLLPSKKSFGQRFGEGLGTATRLLDNSAVRGLIAYGLSKSLGDNNALEQGLTAASMNMAAKNNDKLYRNDLNNMGVDTSGINGYITEDMYKNILASRQMQENAEWRKANLLAQQQQNDILNNIRLRELNIKENEAKRGKPLSDSQVKELKSTSDFVNSLDNIISRYSDAKYDNMFGIKGDIRRNNPLSRYDAEASLFKQDVEILRQRYAKLLEGGRLSDSDRAFYQKALFNPNVSRADFLEAVRRIQQLFKFVFKTRQRYRGV